MAPTIINTAKPRPTPDGLRGDGPGLSAARLFGLLLAFAFVVAAIGSAADRMVATHPDWDRRVPSLFADNAWRYRAYAAMTSHDAAKAVAAARAAVRTGPIDPASSDLLGTALLMDNRPGEATQAFRLAGKLGWRRPDTQIYWMMQSIGSGDWRSAMQRLDAVLRQAPLRAGDASLMRLFETDPVGRAALAAKLSASPPWQSDYAANIAGLDPDTLAARAAILGGLAQRAPRLGCTRVGALVSGLLGAGRAREADGLWRAQCPDAKRDPAAGLLGDGNFAQSDLGRRDSLFSWWAPGDSSISAVVDTQSATGKPRLVASNSAPFTRPVVTRMVYLPPGRYRLIWRTLDAQGRASERILAALGCMAGTGEPLPATLDPRTGMTRAELAALSCPAPWLEFRLAPGAGEVRFGNIALQRF